MTYKPEVDIDGKCMERVPCDCGHGYVSAYDGYCGHCRKRKQQRDFEWKRSNDRLVIDKNHKCPLCKHRYDCELSEYKEVNKRMSKEIPETGDCWEYFGFKFYVCYSDDCTTTIRSKKSGKTYTVLTREFIEGFNYIGGRDSV